jgi:hypothetical protein
MIRTATFASLIALLFAAPASAQGVNDQNPGRFQGGQSGVPLSFFCNHLPDLSVQRSDGVNNWVRICTLWFAANRDLGRSIDSKDTSKTPKSSK